MLPVDKYEIDTSYNIKSEWTKLLTLTNLPHMKIIEKWNRLTKAKLPERKPSNKIWCLKHSTSFTYKCIIRPSERITFFQPFSYLSNSVTPPPLKHGEKLQSLTIVKEKKKSRKKKVNSTFFFSSIIKTETFKMEGEKSV